MRVLVTGGAGFVGSHLVEALLVRGREVVVLDDFSWGRRSVARRLSGAVEVREGSVEDLEAVRAAARGCEEIYHLAGVVGVRRVVGAPALALRSSVGGAANVCEAARRERALLLFTSSSEVYGAGSATPLSERDPLPPPIEGRRGAYGIGKRLAEAIVRRASARDGFPAIVVRLFNVVGPRQRAEGGMVLPSFVEAALRDRPLPVHGDGSQRRCFAFVGDVAEDLVDLAAERSAAGNTVNVGRAQETTILELARRVLERVGSRSPIRFIPLERAPGRFVGRPDRRRPSLETLRRLLGPRATTPLGVAIEAVVAERTSRVAV
jgi:UDP-glucose 4-epimerase